MSNRVYIFLIAVIGLNMISLNKLSADIGHFDIYKLIWEEEVYFFTLESPGQLLNDDLCYYDFKGDYFMEVKSYIDKYLERPNEIYLYSSIESIHVDSIRLANEAAGLESPLYILSNHIKIQGEKLLDAYELLSAKKGNTYGIIISPNLSKTDESWINTSRTKELFIIGEYECSYGFYSSRIPVNSKIADSLREELIKLLPNPHEDVFDEDKSDKFWLKIEELVDDEVVMIGGCSC